MPTEKSEQEKEWDAERQAANAKAAEREAAWKEKQERPAPPPCCEESGGCE